MAPHRNPAVLKWMVLNIIRSNEKFEKVLGSGKCFHTSYDSPYLENMLHN